jgi:lysylphosphatidylglycerol synthetase-like protein (DUF2156 family)
MPRLDRAAALPPANTLGGDWMPRRWPYVLLAMVASIVSAVAATRAMPEPAEAALFGLALLGAACVPAAHAFAVRRRLAARLAAVFCAVVAPLFLFGLAMTRW